MSARYDVIVIGGGVNGLTCAAMLAKRGKRVVLLEGRETTGGIATLAHTADSVRRDVVDELQLKSFGLEFVDSPIEVSSISPDGKPLIIWRDDARTAEGLRAWSAKDADAWIPYRRSVANLTKVIGALFTHTPPSVDDPGARDAWALLRTLRAFRAMPKPDQWRLLRWGPMAVADLVGEVFETELLKATLAADGTFGAMLGPWSAGSGLQMLLTATNHALAAGHSVKGGPVALTQALTKAAERAGVTVRTSSAVGRIDIASDKAAGVTLENGERLEAGVVVSSVDPKHTFLKLCDADYLPPEFLWRLKHYRTRGTLAKITLTLSSPPAFAGVPTDMLQAPIRIAPDLDYLERAFDHVKYRRFSTHPWMELTLNGNIVSAYVQFVPHTCRDQAFADAAIATLEQYAPGLRSRIVSKEIWSPADLEAGFGLSGGQIFHGELSLDQFFTMRPLLGFGQYRTPIPGLYLCGSGSHPGTGLTGGSGANAAREIARA
jgi:phytoene dehydrogenase-like protein